MPTQIHIFVNGHAFHVEDGVSEFMSGADIAALVGISGDKALVRRDIKIDSKDFRVDTYQAYKPARQTANNSYAGTRITHLPTGVVVSSLAGRSQIRNRAEAMRSLRGRLLELRYLKPRSIAMAERALIESGDSFLVTQFP